MTQLPLFGHFCGAGFVCIVSKKISDIASSLQHSETTCDGINGLLAKFYPISRCGSFLYDKNWGF